MSFARSVFQTVFLRGLLVLLGIAQAVVLARWLGPHGRGVYAAIGAAVGVAGMAGGLGLTAAVTRWAAAEPGRVAALTANARVTGGAAGALMLALLYAVSRLVPGAIGDVPTGLLLLAGAALPFSLASSQITALLLGRHRIRAYNLVDASERMAVVFGTAVLLMWFGGGVRSLVILGVALAVLRFAGCHVLVWPEWGPLRPDLGLLRRMLAFSARAYLTILLLFLVQRSDVLLANVLLGAERTGVYSVAVQVVEFLLLVPAAAAVVLLPRVAAASGSGGSSEFTASVCRHAALFVTLSGLVVAAVGSLAVVPLFGQGFRDATPCIWILLPGVWCLALQTILWQDLAGRDYPAVIPALWGGALAVNVGLNLWLMPRLGIAGGAASSTVAYVLSAALLTAYWLRRFPQLKLVDLLVLRRHELGEIGQRIAGALRSGVPPS